MITTKISATEYIRLVQDSRNFDYLYDIVNELTHSERLYLRQKLTDLGCNKHIRSLYYDYDKQVWIK